MRLIDADSLIGELHSQFFYDGRDRTRVYAKIQAQPTITAEPIRHGHWEHGEDVFGMYYQCSECDMQYYGGYEFNYCPECGAKMDEVKDND